MLELQRRQMMPCQVLCRLGQGTTHASEDFFDQIPVSATTIYQLSIFVEHSAMAVLKMV
jgi:hypothetical protein